MTDWKARAEREAASIIAEIGYRNAEPQTLTWLTSLVAIGWLQGANYGSHETLAQVEDSFDELRATL